MFWRNRDVDWKMVGLYVIFVFWIVAMVLFVVARPINKVTNMRTIEGVVTDKTTKKVGKSDKYIVFIDDGSGRAIPLEVTDSLLKWRFNSSDVWGNIEVDKTYSFEVGGSRLGIFSWYPNIYSYEEKMNNGHSTKRKSSHRGLFLLVARFG